MSSRLNNPGTTTSVLSRSAMYQFYRQRLFCRRPPYFAARGSGTRIQCHEVAYKEMRPGEVPRRSVQKKRAAAQNNNKLQSGVLQEKILQAINVVTANILKLYRAPLQIIANRRQSSVRALRSQPSLICKNCPF